VAPGGTILDTCNSDNQRTILLAEDDATVRNFIEKVLKTGGFQVLIAEDGLDALEKAKTHSGKIHLLLSNLQMPRMTGIELATQISVERPDAKVLLMSGLTTGMLVLDKGWQFLPKPFVADMLKQKIELMLQDGQLSVPDL
jgi:two-component system cell cycle sensor histidine kinase/response regulator CckA